MQDKVQDKVNLDAKFASFDETWVPKVVGELNGQYVKLAKFAGEYIWHQHQTEDELFLVVAGRLRIELRDRDVDRDVDLNPGEFFIVPRGVEHKPVAITPLVHVVMFEPATTRNTGDVDHDHSIEPERLDRI